jgi:hypothetical protein
MLDSICATSDLFFQPHGDLIAIQIDKTTTVWNFILSLFESPS